MSDKIIFHNGKIYTTEGIMSWMAIEANRIVGVGNEPVELEGQMIDLGGKLILPGLIDSHIHVHSLGRFSSRLDLKKVGSISEIQLKLEKYQEENNDEWLIGGGWDQDYMEEKRYPNRYDLDLVVTDRPVLLYRGCNHIGVVNSKALEIMKINRESKDPQGGKIDRDTTGEPTGILREEALSLVTPFIQGFDEGKRLSYFKAGLDECLQTGITSVQTNDSKAWKYYKQLHDSGELNIRVFLTIPFSELDEEDTPQKGDQIGLLRCDRVKLFADGSLGAETAALRQPYNGTDNRGILIHNPDQMLEKVRQVRDAGYRVEVHAIGDRAAEIVLDAIEEAGLQPQDRPILTHCQILGEDLVSRMKILGVIANIQPPFVNTDSKWVEIRLGKDHRVKYAYAWKTLLDAGIHVSGGSDAPIEIPDPMYGIYSAITRLSPEGKPWRPEERMNFDEALRIYTQGGAYAAEMEKELGELREGCLADFLVVDPEILEDQERLLEHPVSEVWVDGIPRYTSF